MANHRKTASRVFAGLFSIVFALAVGIESDTLANSLAHLQTWIAAPLVVITLWGVYIFTYYATEGRLPDYMKPKT